MMKIKLGYNGPRLDNLNYLRLLVKGPSGPEYALDIFQLIEMYVFSFYPQGKAVRLCNSPLTQS